MWDGLCNQMNKMSETNRLINKAAKNTGKRLTNVQVESPKKPPSDVKTITKTDN